MNIRKYIETFIRDMRVERLAQSTIKTYADHVGTYLKHFEQMTEPKAINEDAIKNYLLQLPSAEYQRSMHSALKKFYKLTVKQPMKLRYIPYAKKGNKLPVVLTQDEIKRLIAACTNTKHQCIIMLLYGCGMRVSEVINLQIADINSSAMVIHIREAKGKKDRNVMLDESILSALRSYYKAYRPVKYLFNGQFEPQYSERSINQFLKKYAAIAGINKSIHAHTLRHCFATHLMEHNINERMIQQLMGHSNIKTTMRYQHISQMHIANTPSPLALLSA
jgi:site-specific recombinase XerD